MNVPVCRGCGKHLRRGATRWVVMLHLVHDVDPVVETADWEPPEQFLLKLGDISQETAAALEDDVHRTDAFLVCRGCRKQLLAQWGGQRPS